MKNISTLVKIVSLLAIGAAAPGAFGLTTTEAYIESYQGRTDIPVPVKVVAPAADASMVGARVELEFVVDASGRPQNIQVVSATDSDFGVSVSAAVKQWQFAPAKSHGTPVPMKVELPVLVSESR
jgi:TonB family protein